MCPIDWSALAVLILVCRIDDNLMEKYDFLNSYSSFYPNRGQVPLFKGRSFPGYWRNDYVRSGKPFSDI